MKSSHYTWIPALAVTVLLSACSSEGGGFSGANLPAGTPGGGGNPGGGGGGGGGPTVTTEPRLAHQPEINSALFDIEMSGDAGTLVFVSDQNVTGGNPNNGEQLFGVDIGSGGIAQITTAPASNFLTFVDWDITDDGNQVLFGSSEDLTGDNPTLSENLFLAGTGGTGLTQVTRNVSTGTYRDLEVNGAGTLVVFASEMDLVGTNPANDNQLYTINANGTGLTQITFDSAFPEDVALAQNGGRIVYTSAGDPVGNNPDFSREIFVINTDGTDHRQLTDTMGIVNIARPEISDDGGRIVFGSEADLLTSNADGSYEIYTINADGSGLTQVSNSDRDSGVFNNGSRGDYDISGNGSYVVFGSSFDFTGENPSNNHTIFWASADGSTIGQPIREGTVNPSALAFTAQNVSMSNTGDAILFESTVNMSFDATGSSEKIYTTTRQ